MILTHGENSINRGGGNTVEIGGRDYPFVQIGSQLWMVENLDYKFNGCTIGPSGSSINYSAAWYYNNDEQTYGANGNKYGLLYNWYAVNYITNNLQSLGIPNGWHIPTKDEIDTLIGYVGGSHTAGLKLKSKTGWYGSGNGTDDYGFCAYPAGNRAGVSFGGIKDTARFWTQTESNTNAAYYRKCSYHENDVSGTDTSKTSALSVRLVKTAT